MNRFLESTILRSSRTSRLLFTLLNTFLQLHRTFDMPMSSFFAAYLKCCEKEWSDITHCNISWGSLKRGVQERKERFLSIGIYTEVHTVGNSEGEGGCENLHVFKFFVLNTIIVLIKLRLSLPKIESRMFTEPFSTNYRVAWINRV